MLQFLIILSAILFSMLIYLNYRFYYERKAFRERIRLLESIVMTMSRKKHLKDSQVELSEVLRDKLKTANSALSNDIFDFNHELLEILAKNKLL